MPNTYNSQVALSNELSFITRVRGALVAKAYDVLAEQVSSPMTNEQAGRRNYAFRVLNSPDPEAARIAKLIVHRPNVNNFVTSYDFESGRTVTTSGDAELFSQIGSDWNSYASV